MTVLFEVLEVVYPLAERKATILAEGLRIQAAQGYDEHVDPEVRRALADEIEERLVGRTADPVRLEGELALAAFYYMNVAASVDDEEIMALYRALRALRYAAGS